MNSLWISVVPFANRASGGLVYTLGIAAMNMLVLSGFLFTGTVAVSMGLKVVT